MRMMQKGYPFMDVKQEVAPWPDEIGDIPDSAPVFSEATLYPTLGKGDARFVLGVAGEYDHVIKALGPKAVRAILDVKPKLVERLGVGEEVAKSLEDARDENDLLREQEHPSEVRIDADAAHAAWEQLHYEYRRLFDPESSMDGDSLRAYHELTEALGEHEKKMRKEEQDRLPEKLERKRAQRERVAREREARQAVYEAADGKGDPEAAVKLYREVFG